MASFFNNASTPADNGTQAGPTVAVTPPGSMVTGDLVCMVAGYKNSGVTMAVSNTGGQSWTAEPAGGGATSGLTIRLFWCRYNGTWAANPSVTITSGTLAMSVHMIVFRPDAGSSTWSVVGTTTTTDSGAAAVQGTTSRTIPAGDLAFAAVITNDDNTLTGGGGFDNYIVQFRNLQGNDISMGFAYTTGLGFSNGAAWNEATLGNDTGATVYAIFHETASSVFISEPPYIKSQAVNRSGAY